MLQDAYTPFFLPQSCLTLDGEVILEDYLCYVHLPKRSNDWTAIGGFSLYYLGKDKGNMAVEDIASSEATVIAIYNTNGIRIATMQKGINILHMSDGTTIKVVVQ